MENFDLKRYLIEGKLLRENEQPTHRITTDVYYVNNYEFDGFDQEAVPEYEISNIEDMLGYDSGNFLYIKSGTEGQYEEGMFTTSEGSDTRIEPKYIEKL
jgi:hypothetical protein